MGVVGRLDQYASMLVTEFDEYSMAENLVLQTSEIGNNSGTYLNGGIVGLNTTATTSPNGLNEATLVDNNGNVNQYVYSQQTALTTNTTYTYSIHIKQGTKPDFQVTIDENSFGGKRYYVGFTYSNETVTSGITGGANDGVVVGSTATKLTNGWYRLSLTFTTSTNTVSTFVDMINRFGNTPGSNYVWGRQLEKGSVATDYTPTTSTAISRVLPATTNTNITNLGTYYASGFDENVGFTTFLSANVFAPYDPVYDEFGGTLFGPGQGRYMRQNTDKSVIVYNEIDEITDFRNIVRTGLVLDLDAGMNSSFNNTGTTWNDLSGNGKNATAQNGVGYITSNGSGLTFDGTDDHFIISQRETSSQFTYEAFLMPTNVSKDQMYAGTTSDGFYLRITGSKAFLSISAGSQRTLTHDTTLQNNQVYHIVSIYNGVQLKIYVNNVLTSGTVINATMSAWGVDRIGRWRDVDQRSFVGNIYCLRAYNRELSESEILQNYNALKHRFGL